MEAKKYSAISSIPMGLCNSAQGCESDELPWVRSANFYQPQRGCDSFMGVVYVFGWCRNPFRVVRFSQGSSLLAAPGFVAESLWDTAGQKRQNHGGTES